MNNNKEWFTKNKSRFENEFLIPASDFVVELGERIRQFAPNTIAIPKIDKSIFWKKFRLVPQRQIPDT